VLQTEKRKEPKDLARCSQISTQSGTPDSVRCAKSASDEQATFGKTWRRTAIIHRTVRWCTGLSSETTTTSAMVGRAIRRRRVARAIGGLGAPDCPVCTGQCPVRQPARSCNDRLRQIRKEINTEHATVTIRWCTGLSGAPPDRRQELPSLLASNGS
jgi:hypothetical protein